MSKHGTIVKCHSKIQKLRIKKAAQELQKYCMQLIYGSFRAVQIVKAVFTDNWSGKWWNKRTTTRKLHANAARWKHVVIQLRIYVEDENRL